jgi:hypothetical protein
VVRVRVDRASLVAIAGFEEAVLDPAPFPVEPPRRTRLAVVGV